jgi:hypothetical protein
MPKLKTPKLKTYVADAGFYEIAVAAPSMKAALAAWGMTHTAFHQGFARQSDDAAAIRKAEKALAQAQAAHDKRAAALRRQRDTLDDKITREDEAWRTQEGKRKAALARATKR